MAWENLITQLIHSFSYIFFAMSFYVSILWNIGFRRKCKELLKMKKDNDSRDPTLAVIRTYASVNHQPNYR
jgi:hypothetical protein